MLCANIQLYSQLKCQKAFICSCSVCSQNVRRMLILSKFYF
uniref:Uncharacterized protein n=1 Tax=Rhizophora mucronata TaxID=61149 RepID=A0A2P2PD91_RHIMU